MWRGKTGGEQIEAAHDRRREIQSLPLRRLVAHEGEDLSDESVSLLDRPLGGDQGFERRTVARQTSPRHVEKAADREERVVEIVRDATGERAERQQPFGLNPLSAWTWLRASRHLAYVNGKDGSFAMSRADAIVVLGCRMPPDGKPGGALVRRVEHAAALWYGGAAPLLLLSGGGERSRSEAEAMRALALAAGIPAEAILLEERSRNTLENARFSAEILEARRLGRVVVVSEAYHLFRARLLFRAAGLRVVASSAPPVRLRRDLLMYLRETVALPRSLWRLAGGRIRAR
jgi:uncharacterized SAM-binding protein YcdF (DUF218 family)